MQFPNPIVNRLVIYGSDGSPDVAIGPEPVIVFYDSTGFEMIQIGYFDSYPVPRFKIQDPDGNSTEIRQDPNQPPLIQMHNENASGVAAASILWHSTYSGAPTWEEYFEFGAIMSGAPPQPFVFIRARSDGGYFPAIQVSDPIIATELGTTDRAEWHALTILSGTGPVSFKLMPDGTIIFSGNIFNPNNVAGQDLFQMPDPYYYPLRICRFVCPTGGATSTTPGWIQINTAGLCEIARPVVGGTPDFWFDGVRYPIASTPI